ncbi:MAG TPA: bifunctional DNA-formamidopyrimidine glycosylase/DNA-(apurinic or apyrimidinic site) lyase [Bryobacteraceae bacterium]|nr:bifunctional DNA-formamidopyrimidine glycosylase/DNA-(apurinic or apyrimidinic site) lyase [Bryobacteraceae bacterium]
MPELPEVETVVRSLAPHLPGRRIVAAEFTSRHVTPGNRAALARKLAGRMIHSVARRGKYILIQLDEGTLTVHLGMTGQLLLDPPPSDHSYGIFHLDTGVLVYRDPRQFGSISLLNEGSNARANKSLAKLGPEPLEIAPAEFAARLKTRKIRMKALLLDQTFVAGIGNIYADEILYSAKVHPLAIAARLSKPRVALVHQAMREVLTLAIEHGGSSISDYVNAAGERGWFQTLHNAYDREGEPCQRCGGIIKRILVAQRGTHFCPQCQKR